MAAPKLRFKEFGSEYNEYNLGKLLKSYRLGGNYSNSEIKTNFPLIKMGNLNRGSINLSKIEYIPSDEIIDDEDRIQLGDLFFNTRNTLDLVGKVAIWRNELPVAYYNSNLMRLEFENNFYMNFLLNTEKSLEKLKAIASGTTSVAAIYTKDLLKVKVKVPFVDEQTKIATFLSAVDEKINQLIQKHELLSQYKQGMMQKLFNQQIRFKANDGSEFGEWEEIALGKIKGVSIASGKSSHEKLELAKYYYYGSTGVIGYSNEYDYQGTRILIARVGHNAGYIYMVSGQYNVSDNTLILELPSNLDYIFIRAFLEKFQLNKLVFGTGQPLITGGLLKKVVIQVPCLEEQTKIANFFSGLDQKIEVVAQQIKQANTWKKGLLQQMFV